MTARPLPIALVCEADADFRTASGIAERVINEDSTSSRDEDPRELVSWVNCDGGQFIRWRDVPRLASEHGIRKHGHFDGKPGAPDAHAGRKAILVVLRKHADCAILLIRDSDGDFHRRNGLEQARKESHANDRIAIGVCHPNRECWVLSGFTPTSREQKILADTTRELGFDPCRESHRLNDRGENQKRNAKRVLRLLVGGDRDREEACWSQTALHTIESNGAENGLCDFISEIRVRIAPLIGR